MEPIINKPRKVVRTALLLTLLMITGAVITGYSGLPGMQGGYALIMLFAFFALCALVTALVYIPRARAFDKLVHELKPLARWTYSQDEWDQFVAEDLKETTAINKATLRWVSIVSLVVCAGLMVVYRDALFIWIIAGILFMLTIVAFSFPLLRARMLRKGIRETIIGETAAYTGGTFQTWTQLGSRLTGVDIYKEAPIPVLHIIYEFPTLQAWQQEIVRIPVPAGKMEEAERIRELLSKQIH